MSTSPPDPSSSLSQNYHVDEMLGIGNTELSKDLESFSNPSGTCSRPLISFTARNLTFPIVDVTPNGSGTPQHLFTINEGLEPENAEMLHPKPTLSDLPDPTEPPLPTALAIPEIPDSLKAMNEPISASVVVQVPDTVIDSANPQSQFNSSPLPETPVELPDPHAPPRPSYLSNPSTSTIHNAIDDAQDAMRPALSISSVSMQAQAPSTPRASPFNIQTVPLPSVPRATPSNRNGSPALDTALKTPLSARIDALERSVFRANGSSPLKEDLDDLFEEGAPTPDASEGEVLVQAEDRGVEETGASDESMTGESEADPRLSESNPAPLDSAQLDAAVDDDAHSTPTPRATTPLREESAGEVADNELSSAHEGPNEVIPPWLDLAGQVGSFGAQDKIGETEQFSNSSAPEANM